MWIYLLFGCMAVVDGRGSNCKLISAHCDRVKAVERGTTFCQNNDWPYCAVTYIQPMRLHD